MYEDGQDEVVLSVDSPCQLLGVGLCGTEGCLTVELDVYEVGVGKCEGGVWGLMLSVGLPCQTGCGAVWHGGLPDSGAGWGGVWCGCRDGVWGYVDGTCAISLAVSPAGWEVRRVCSLLGGRFTECVPCWVGGSPSVFPSDLGWV